RLETRPKISCARRCSRERATRRATSSKRRKPLELPSALCAELATRLALRNRGMGSAAKCGGRARTKTTRSKLAPGFKPESFQIVRRQPFACIAAKQGASNASRQPVGPERSRKRCTRNARQHGSKRRCEGR